MTFNKYWFGFVAGVLTIGTYSLIPDDWPFWPGFLVALAASVVIYSIGYVLALKFGEGRNE